MALSRILSQKSLAPLRRTPTAAAITTHNRHRSSKTPLIEVDLDGAAASSSSSDSPEAAAEIITVGIRKLEDAIHSIIVRRSAPDWLPFLPGYSYWVPPRGNAARDNHHQAGNMIEVIGKLAAASTSAGDGRLSSPLSSPLSEDEQMCLTSAKGWPSSAFFIEGTSPVHPIPVVEVEVKIQDTEENTYSSSNSDGEP